MTLLGLAVVVGAVGLFAVGPFVLGYATRRAGASAAAAIGFSVVMAASQWLNGEDLRLLAVGILGLGLVGAFLAWCGARLAHSRAATRSTA